MGNIKKLFSKIEHYILKHPKLIIVITFFGFLVLLSGFECIRAYVYLDSADSYKKSAQVVSLKDKINKLNKVAGQSSANPAYCSLSLEGLIKYVNVAYEDLSDDVGDSSTLIQSIHEQAQIIDPSPAFNSMLQYLPRVREARRESEDMKSSLKKIKNLTSEDSRSSYCLSLVNSLSEVYFINDIRTPQGVSAMRVGQLENFHIDVGQAQDLLQELSPPKVFSEPHIAINELLNNLRLDLQEDSNQYELFSRNIQADYEQLVFHLKEIEIRSTDLLSRPEQLAIYSSAID